MTDKRPTLAARMAAVAKQERAYRQLEQHAIAAHRKYPIITEPGVAEARSAYDRGLDEVLRARLARERDAS